jgi:predicted RNA-binding protein with RPS1 domain
MDDGIGKVDPVSTGKDSLSIRGEHTTESKPRAPRIKPKAAFNDVLQKKEEEVLDREKRKKQAPHAKYKNGKRIY